jgi:hypothetical protein
MGSNMVSGAVEAGEWLVESAKSTWESIVAPVAQPATESAPQAPANDLVGGIKQVWSNIIDKTKEIGQNVVDTTKEVIHNPVEYIDTLAWKGQPDTQAPVQETENTTNLDNLGNAA